MRPVRVVGRKLALPLPRLGIFGNGYPSPCCKELRGDGLGSALTQPVSSRAGPAQQQESGMSDSRNSASAVNTMSLARSGAVAGLPVHGCRLRDDGGFTVTCGLSGTSGSARRRVGKGKCHRRESCCRVAGLVARSGRPRSALLPTKPEPTRAPCPVPSDLRQREALTGVAQFEWQGVGRLCARVCRLI
jgi:hypothetical protein